jgi:tetratricopeptide (TPR) repeat protein
MTTTRARLVVAVAAVLAIMALPCMAQHAATVYMKNGSVAEGTVRYLPSSREYEIDNNKIKQKVRLAQVDRVVLKQQPAGLQQAVAAVNRGDYTPTQLLAQIVSAYPMMGPDVQAGQALAVAYLRTNRAKEALKVCEDLLKNNPDSLKSGAFASVYSEILLAEGRIPALRGILRTMVETGSRDVAAVAQVRRGDLEMHEKKPREALLDGYLRTILLFKDVTFIQPEALYKAIKAHEALNEVQYAERWRKQLLGQFGTSEFAAKLRQ